MSTTEVRVEGGSRRPDGSIRPVVVAKANWVGDLEKVAYKPKGQRIQEQRKAAGPVGGKLAAAQPASSTPNPSNPQKKKRNRGKKKGPNSDATENGDEETEQDDAEDLTTTTNNTTTATTTTTTTTTTISTTPHTPAPTTAKTEEEKEIIKLTKKLKEITVLEEKRTNGESLNGPQIEKVNKKREFQRQLEQLKNKQ